MPASRVHAQTDRPLTRMSYAAMAIAEGGIPGVLHAGLLFVDIRGPDSVMMLHLEMHHRLRCVEPSADCFWVELGMMPERARLVARFCRTIDKRYPTGELQYALAWTGEEPAEDGEFLTPNGRGFTCVTFVLSVLSKMGVARVDRATWPAATPRDVNAQKAIVKLLESQEADPVHVAAVRRQIGCARFTAEQAAAAVAADFQPVAFEYAERVGVQIRAKVTARAHG